MDNLHHVNMKLGEWLVSEASGPLVRRVRRYWGEWAIMGHW